MQESAFFFHDATEGVAEDAGEDPMRMDQRVAAFDRIQHNDSRGFASLVAVYSVDVDAFALTLRQVRTGVSTKTLRCAVMTGLMVADNRPGDVPPAVEIQWRLG